MNPRTVCVFLSLTAAVVQAEMVNARIRFEESDALVVCEKTMHLKQEVVQTSGDWLVIDPDAFTEFQPADPNGSFVHPEGALSPVSLVHVKELGYGFSLATAGEYDVWMHVWFPLAAGYNHGERMDDGEVVTVWDSVDAMKIDKFGQLPSGSAMRDKWLQPNMWHWIKNMTYDLGEGLHRWHWPSPNAWRGGCHLDRIVLVKKGSSVKPDEAPTTNRKVVRAEQGATVSRRVKTERIRSWRFDAQHAAGGGKIAFSYSFGGETWQPFEPEKVYRVPPDSGYLHLRIDFEAAPDGAEQPVLHGYRFRVEKKPR